MLKKAVVTLLFLLNTPLAWSEEYRVGINDQLNIRIATWDAANGQILEEPGVSGIYRVGAAGDIAVSVLGSIDVLGQTTLEVATALEAAMVSYAPVGQSPKAAVAIEAYAPIYITGQIAKPGVYEFATDLTAFKAVAIAGGLAGVKPIEGQKRNFLSARGTVNMLQQELMFLIARRDRIMAEIEGASDLAGIPSDADQQDAWMTEDAILQSRNARYAQQLQSLENAQASLREALVVLEAKQATTQGQLEAGEAELQRDEDLIERGLVAQNRAFAGGNYVSELQTRLLDIERSILDAKQDLQDNERDAGLLQTTREEENVVALQQVNASVAEVEAQIATQFDLLSAAAGQHAGQITLLDPNTAEAVYEVTRTQDGETETFRVDRNAAMRPGDIVEVLFAPPALRSN